MNTSMNPLLDPQAEARFDEMIAELDKVGYTWDGALASAPDGYKFHGLLQLPFYQQVYQVWDHYQWRQRVEKKSAESSGDRPHCGKDESQLLKELGF